MRRIASVTVTIFIILLIIYFAWQLRQAIWLFFLSLAVSAAFQPAINVLTKHKFSHKIAILITYALGFGILVGLILLIANPLMVDLENMLNETILAYDDLLLRWSAGHTFQQTISTQLPSSDEIYNYLADDNGIPLLQMVLGLTSGLFNSLANLAIIFVLSLYWSADHVRFEQLWLSLVPARQRGRARIVWRAIEEGTGDFVRDLISQSVLIGSLLGTGYWLLDVDYPVLLATLGALVRPIPILGPILLFVPPLIILLIANLQQGLFVAVFTLLALLIQSWITNSWLKQRRVNSMLLILAILALTNHFGLIGLLMASPLAAAIQILIEQLLQQQPAVISGKTIPELVDLKIRLTHLQQQFDQQSKPVSREVASMAVRLEKLIEETLSHSEAETDNT